jgi:nucleoside-diphosphate kinase
MLKPLAVYSPTLIAEIKSKLSEVGTISDERLASETSKDQVEDHYVAAEGKPYFRLISDYIIGKSVLIFILTKNDDFEQKYPGIGYVDHVRKKVIGPSRPEQASPEHIRHLAVKRNLAYIFGRLEHEDGVALGIDNLIHCSDTPENAEREISLWYKKRT